MFYKFGKSNVYMCILCSFKYSPYKNKNLHIKFHSQLKFVKMSLSIIYENVFVYKYMPFFFFFFFKKILKSDVLFKTSDSKFVFTSLYIRDFSFALSDRTLLPANADLGVVLSRRLRCLRDFNMLSASPLWPSLIFTPPVNLIDHSIFTYPSVSCWCGRRSGWGRSPWWRAEKRRRPSGRCQVQPRRCKISVPCSLSLFADARWVLDAGSAPTCLLRRVPTREFPFSHQDLFLGNSKFLLANANEESDVTLRESPTRSLVRWHLCTTKVRGS